MDQPRLTPAMSSRKTIVLDYVTAYIGDHNGRSPSLSNIAAACGLTSRQHARDIVTQLVVDGALRRLRGQAQGLLLPSDVDKAVRLARAGGFVVIDPAAATGPPYSAFPLTFSTLPRMPDLDQIAGGDGGGGDDEHGAERDGPTGPTGDRESIPPGSAGSPAERASALPRGAPTGAVESGLEQAPDERRSAA